jgi:hypothetical protein
LHSDETLHPNPLWVDFPYSVDDGDGSLGLTVSRFFSVRLNAKHGRLFEPMGDFIEEPVMLPGLKLIQWHCDRRGDSIRLAVGQSTGDAVLDQLLMECFAGEDSPANTSAELPRRTEPLWLIASLRLQPEVLPGSRTFFYGLREYIGSCQIEWRLPTEQMIQAIKKQKVLFDELSWVVLQIIQNAGWLPYSERPKGWSLVACFTQSARRTIWIPTEAVECNTKNAKFFKFRFERRFSEDRVGW